MEPKATAAYYRVEALKAAASFGAHVQNYLRRATEPPGRLGVDPDWWMEMAVQDARRAWRYAVTALDGRA